MIQSSILKDEHPRKDIAIDSLSKLKPTFKKNGSIYFLGGSDGPSTPANTESYFKIII